ncbi:hypothetical protein ADK77_21865 [Streptomyces antibioticus]|nr:hypothetical protein ADK77_21865 [Streptomyces antibioticus]
MGVVQYVDAFNRGDAEAMAATCADPMQTLDGMAPHVWQGPTAGEECAPGAFGLPHVVVPATMTRGLRGKRIVRSGS